MGMYSKRVWLNKDGSPSTGSVVAFYGETTWRKEKDVSTFLEVADCHDKIRLHRTHDDSMEDFVKKLRLLATTANDFATFLESEEK
jgi:hypothetical protein